MGTPTLCIAIATYRRPKDLDNCLAALVPQLSGRTGVRVVVVNDASHDESYQTIIRKHEGVIDYRVQSQNGGPGMARAAAFAGATEDYLVCTDDDCIAPPDWLDTLISVLVANRGVDLVAGAVRPVWTDDPSLYRRLLAVPASYPAPAFSREGLLTAVTANCAYRSEAYERAGGFNPAIRGATEDCYITQRILRNGGSYVVPGHLVMGHKAENRLGEMRRRFRGYGMGGAQIVFMEKLWQLAEISSDGSWRDAWRSIRSRVRRSWSESRRERRNLLTRFLFASITGLLAFEYERGWRRGIRRFGEREAKLPQRPGLGSRFVNFSDPGKAAIALGQKSS